MSLSKISNLSILVTFLISTSISICSCQSDPKKVLFIGNSMTYFNGGVDWHLNMMVEKSGLKPGFVASSYTVPLASLEQLWKEGVAQRKITENNFDIVILQESNRKLDSDSFKRSVRLFSEIIRKAKAEPILYMPWEVHTPPGAPDQASIEKMHEEIATELNIRVVPVGLAFLALQKEMPDVRLIEIDGHPSMYGTYLAACVMYAALFNEKPFAQSHLTKMPTKLNQMFQRIAWDTLQSYGNKRK